MLTLWSDQHPNKVYRALSTVTSQYPNIPTQVVSDFSVPEGTKVVLGLGRPSVDFLASAGLIPKGRTVTSQRGIPHALGGVPVLVSYAPDIGEINHAYAVDLLCDASAAIRLMHTGSMRPEYGDYRYVKDFSEIIAQVQAKYAATGQPVDASLDLETVGLDPYRLPSKDHPGAYIVTAQLCAEEGKADVVYFNSRLHEHTSLAGLVGAQLNWWCNTPMIRLKGANLKFDLGWLRKRAAIKCTNFTFDTTLVGSLLDENRSNGLEVHTKIYAPSLFGYSDEFDRTIDKSRMDLVPKETLLPYAGGDPDANLRVARVMKQELLADPALARFYVNILHPAARAFEQIEQGGVLVDLDAYKELRSDLRQELETISERAKRMIGGRLAAKHLDTWKPNNLNLIKPSLLVDFMFTPMGLNLTPKVFTGKTKAPSSSLDHMLMFAQDKKAGPFVALLKDYSAASKTYSTYVGEVGQEGFLKHLRSDGRFHPSYWLFVGDKSHNEGGTNTGRTSCKDPAFQTIPIHTKWGERIRRCYPAPPGYVVVARDYSAGELRVVADIAGVTNMLKSFEEGKDPHVLTAAPFAGYTYDSLMALKKTDYALYEATRQLGKAGNFGLVYGMGVDGFIDYAFNNYSVVLTWDKANEFRESYFQNYQELLQYHAMYKAYARKHGYVRGPLGRLRHLPLIKSPLRDIASKAERNAINSPVQMTLSDMLIWSIALEHQSGLSDIAPSFGAVHDAGYNYCPEDKVDIIVPQLVDQMQNLPFHIVDWKPKVFFKADAKVGKNMADLTKFEGKAAA